MPFHLSKLGSICVICSCLIMISPHCGKNASSLTESDTLRVDMRYLPKKVFFIRRNITTVALMRQVGCKCIKYDVRIVLRLF